MDATPPRAGIERRLCEAIERGWTLAGLEGEPGFPSRRTVSRWSRESPRLAEALRLAREGRRGLRAEARAAPCFSTVQAEALLERLRRGEALAELLRRPEYPNRRTLTRWKRERPDFALELAAATAVSRRLRGTRWRSYDRAVGDEVVCALAAGGRLEEVLAEPGRPCPGVVARWRRAQPGFDHAVRMALAWGRRRRAAQAADGRPAVVARLCRRIAEGGALDGLAGARGLPHRATLHRWLRRDPALAAELRAARAARDDALADELLALAEGATPETLEAARRRVAEIRLALGRRGERRRR
jgi:hypothetical protein